MSLFGDGIQNILDAMRAVKGETVTYKTAAAEITINAAPLKGKQSEDVENSTAFLRTEQDWSIAVAELVDDDDNAIEPAVGHQIIRTLAGIVLTYTLTPAGDSDEVATFQDAAQTHYRVRSKLTTKAPVV